MTFDNNDSTSGVPGKKSEPQGKPEEGETFDASPHDILPIESFPVGFRSPLPEKEEPYYYDVDRAADGTMTVGPFEVGAAHIKTWLKGLAPNELQELVSARQLRQSTVVALQSDQFKVVLDLLESGQKPSPEMIERFVPGDLQRVVARKILGK